MRAPAEAAEPLLGRGGMSGFCARLFGGGRGKAVAAPLNSSSRCSPPAGAAASGVGRVRASASFGRWPRRRIVAVCELTGTRPDAAVLDSRRSPSSWRISSRGSTRSERVRAVRLRSCPRSLADLEQPGRVRAREEPPPAPRAAARAAAAADHRDSRTSRSSIDYLAWSTSARSGWSDGAATETAR